MESTQATLADFVRDEFVPTVQHLKRKSQEKFVTALRLFCRFTRPDVTVDQVTPKTLGAFDEWMVQQGYSLAQVGVVVRLVQRLMRAAAPDRFPQHRQRPGTEAAEEDQGELWRFVVDTYEPTQLVGAYGGTIKKHRRAVCRLSGLLGRPAEIADLTDLNVSRLMQGLIDHGQSKMTANDTRAKLLAVWKLAHRRRLTDSWPEIKKLREYSRAPESWSGQDVARIFASAAQERGDVGRIPAAAFWTALLYVLYDTGARVGAAMLLEWAKVDLDCRAVTLLAENQKQSHDQQITISPEAVAALRGILSPRRLVFPWPHNTGTLFRRYRAIIKRAGLPHGSRCLFHKLRRTHATMLVDVAGLEAASLALGHSSPRMTRDSYVDMSKVRQLRPCDLIPRPTGPGEKPLSHYMAEFEAEFLAGQDDPLAARVQFNNFARFVRDAGFLFRRELTPAAIEAQVARLAGKSTCKAAAAMAQSGDVLFRQFCEWLDQQGSAA